MKRTWRKSLAAQFVGLTLGALVLSQLLTMLISLDEYTKKFDEGVKADFISRAASTTRLMSTLAPEERQDALHAVEGSYLRYWITETEPVNPDAWRTGVVSQLSRPIDKTVDRDGKLGWAGSTFPELPSPNIMATANRDDPWRNPTPFAWMLSQPAQVLQFADGRGYGYKSQLDDGRWLNAAFYQHESSGLWTSSSMISLMLTASLLAFISAFIAARIAQPLHQLAESAEALGRGQNLPPLAEDGPDEIKRTARSFNRMQRRLQRFVEDRTKMLAAIGHDLRTPLTSLRLRAEFVEDEDIQRKMIATVEELQAMTEAAISFAKGESITEETRVVDLDALLSSICADQADVGQAVYFNEGQRMFYRCRPDSLRRALRNLIDNAVRYGGEARVSLRRSLAAVEIIIEDRGPGIPDDMIEKVFEPFVRLESSRNRQTGGVGLGLSIVRAAARQHGGDIQFCRIEAGMQAIMSLPSEGYVEPTPGQGRTDRRISMERWMPQLPARQR